LLDGLSKKYDPSIVVITSRTEPYTDKEIEALLLAWEERFEKHRRRLSNRRNIHSVFFKLRLTSVVNWWGGTMVKGGKKSKLQNPIHNYLNSY